MVTLNGLKVGEPGEMFSEATSPTLPQVPTPTPATHSQGTLDFFFAAFITLI